MTAEQASDILAELQNQSHMLEALGIISGQVVTWLEVVSILLLIVVFFAALRRS